MKKSYCTEKLTDALSALISGRGDVRSRLVIAHRCLRTLTTSDFPQELQCEWNEIINHLTKYSAVKNAQGDVVIDSVQNTMKNIQNRTGEKIAKKIENLYWAISENERYR